MMQGNSQGLQILAKLSAISIGRIKYVPDAEAETILSIRRGIFLLMAFWSATSIRSFVALTEVIARLKDESLELVVADIDGCKHEIFGDNLDFVFTIHGNGETAWIRDGKIIAMSGLGLHLECYERNTVALLSAK